MKRAASLGLWLILVGCAPVEGPPPAEPLSPEPVALPPVEISPRLLSRPDAEPRGAAVRALSEAKFTLNVQDTEIGGLLLGLGHSVPLNIVIGPGVTGTVSADLEKISLLGILEGIVRPRGYHYRIDGRTVRVFKTDRETRFYTLNYPNTVRKASAEFTIAGAISQELRLEGASGGGSSGDSSRSNVTTEHQLDLWTDTEQGVRLIVFGSKDGKASDTEPGPNGLPVRSVLVSRQAGIVMVTAPHSTLVEVERYLNMIARSLSRQVLIDTRIVEVSLSDEFDFGLDVEVSPGFSSGGSNTVGTILRTITGGIARDNAILGQDLAPVLTSGGFSFGIANDSLGVVLNALARQSDLRIISRPRIATLSNHKALIKVVRNEVFFIAQTEVAVTEGVAQTTVTDFPPSIIPIGITLDVTPIVSDSGEITLHVHPSVSEIVEIRQQPQLTGQGATGSLPVVDIREADMVLRVQSGQTVVIGGLIQRRELDIEKKIPILGDLPFVGQLFRRTDIEERRSELVIFLSPTVLDAPAVERVVADADTNLADLNRKRLSRRVIRTPWWRHPSDWGGP